MIGLKFSPGHMLQNAQALCELFQIPDESCVPIERFRVCADGTEIDACVGPEQYKTALLLFYLMAGAPHQSSRFHVTSFMQAMTVSLYYDFTVPGNAPHRPGSDLLMGPILLKQDVFVELELKPGYEKHLAAFRAPEEAIVFGWERREVLTPDSTVPLLRTAITWFLSHLERRLLPMSTLPDGWPSEKWVERVLILQQKLSHQPACV